MRRAAIACVLLAATGCGDDGGSGDVDAGPDDDDPDAAVLGTLTFTSSIAGVPTPLAWVGTQDQNGAWRTITSDDGIYAIDLTSQRWGIAYVCDGATTDELFVFNATLDDMTELARSCPSGVVPESGQISVQFTGLDGDGAAIVGFGNGSSLATMASPNAMQALPAGTWDMPYVIKPDNTDIGRFGIATAALAAGNTVIIGVDAVGSTLPVVDHVLTAVDPLGGPIGFNASFLSASGSAVTLRQPAPSTYATIPLAVLRDGDMHQIRASVSNGDEYSIRSAIAYFHEGRDSSLELPGGFTSQVAVSYSPPDEVRVELVFDELPGTSLYSFEAHPLSSVGTTHSLRWLVTPAWLAEEGGVSHEWNQPDFSRLEDWRDEWYFPFEDQELSFHHDAIATTGESFALDYIERSPDTPWFNVPGSWDGDQVTISSVTDGLAPL